MFVPSPFQITKVGNASYPSLIVDNQLGVLVLVNGQVLVEQDLPQHLDQKSISIRTKTNFLLIPLKVWYSESHS